MRSSKTNKNGNISLCQLSELGHGARARMHKAELQCDECDMLNALGMTDQCRFRVCKIGNPCIIQVGGTRIGLSASLTDKITVEPEQDS